MRKLGCDSLCVALLHICCLVAAQTLLAAPNTPTQQRYRILDLGSLPDIPKTQPIGLSGEVVTDNDQILGSFILIDRQDRLQVGSFLWFNGYFSGLEKLPFHFDMNNKGQVVGFTNDAKLRNKAAFWESGTLHLLNGFRGYNADSRGIDDGSKAFGINNNSQIVGWSTLKGNTHAVLWNNGTLRDLGVLPGSVDSSAKSINDRGQVIGVSGAKNDRIEYACLWQNGEIHSLDSMVEARAINNQGQVLGERMPDGSHDTSKNLRQKACLWQKGKTIDLGSLPHCDYSDAYAINDSGQVVGEAETVPGPWHAFLWQNGKMRDLNDVVANRAGLLLRKAVSINNKGEILCEAKDKEGDHLLLLSPVANE